MNENELESFIEQSFRQGYSIEEIHEALKDEGVKESKIREAVADLKAKISQNQSGQNSQRRTQNTKNSQNKRAPAQTNQSTPGNKRQQKRSRGHKDVIKGIELTEDYYKVKQRLLFNRYHIYDSDDNLILKAKQKILKLKEDIPFMDEDNNVVFRAKAEGIIDVAGDYAITEESSGEPIVVLDKKYTLFRHKWKIRDHETEELLANVESHNKNIEVLRLIGDLLPYLPNVFGFIPHRYDVKDRDGNILAELKGKLSIRDIYEIEINNHRDIPREALVAATITIDALEAN